ncbi:MAG: hypothetical protein IJE65_02820 [Clostridia bacterium]|nr:hypothetical protein [Clostridia bacterium]
MKKIAFVLEIILMLFCFVSCRHAKTYNLLNPIDKIDSISIVTVSFNEDSDIVQTEVKKIEDIRSFLNELSNIDCYTFYGDPRGLTNEGEEDTVIKICYKNGEYEMINWSGQANYTIKRGFRFYAGYSIFDEDQFELLLSKYL